nr:nucleoside 2-deoxyribosyltransferase [Desulfobulbaceae bacterium]
MKIYFAGSIRGGREDAGVYWAMIEFLRTFGEVLTEHVGDLDLTEKGDDGPSDRFIHDRDMEWLRRCDLVVAEVSQPSLGVGYELGWAAAWHKPTLCLFRTSQASLSAMVAGSAALETVLYSSLAEAQLQISDFIRKNSRSLSSSQALKAGGE